MDNPKDDPLIRDHKTPVKPSFFQFISSVIGVPLYLIVLLPLTILSLLFKKITGIKLAAPSKPLPGITLDSPHEIIDLEKRKYQLVLFGATGFTGKLAAQYLAKNYGTKIKWAIAGRNLDSLSAIRKDLCAIDSSLSELPLLVCDATKPTLLQAVISETCVIASSVGPFTLYGTPVVSLCAQLGTSYCDITGELDWVRKMTHDYHNEASKTGARIINLAGHDCIPWDLATFKIANELKQKGESLVEIEHFDNTVISPSGGTLETIFLAINHPQKQKFPFDPLLTSVDGKTKSDCRVDIKSAMYLQFSKSINKWVGPYLMALPNGNCIRRSNAVLNYSKNLVYREAQVYQDFFSGFTLFFSLTVGVTCLLCLPLQWLLKTFVLPKPGSGPTKQQMDKGYLKVNSIGRGDKGSVVRSMLYFPTDPGYRDTARMLVETALTLLDADKLTIGGGVWTPACIGDPLLERLINTGCTWRIDD